jgi:hypothetical protein
MGFLCEQTSSHHFLGYMVRGERGSGGASDGKTVVMRFLLVPSDLKSGYWVFNFNIFRSSKT